MKPIQINDLNWAYQENEILKSIQLEIQAGQFTGIVGPNGSGKTTLVKLLTKLLSVEHKTVFINGADLAQTSISALAKKVALVPQSSQIEFDLSVHEVVEMGRTPHLKRFQRESEHDRDSVKNAMLETDTWQYRNRSVQHLSGGERQRVIIAKALAQEPEILVLDEPVTYLDMQHQLNIMQLVRELATKKNITVLMIMHDLNFALKYCDQLIMLKEGQVYRSGKPDHVMTVDNIKSVYEIDVSMIEHPKTKKTHILF